MITDYMKYRRALKNGQANPAAKKKPQKIRQFSKKREKLNRRYAEKSRPFWKDQECELKRKGCSRMAEGIHHPGGKDTPKLLMDKNNWMRACNSCNLWCEVNDAEARKLGFKVSRLK